MPNTLTLSHSSRAMAIVNQPVLNHELDFFLEDKVTLLLENNEIFHRLYFLCDKRHQMTLYVTTKESPDERKKDFKIIFAFLRNNKENLNV